MHLIRSLLLYCFVCALSELTEEIETANRREKQNDLKDFNHPGQLINVQSLQQYFDELDEDVQNRFPECKSIQSSHVPAGLNTTDRAMFDYNFQEWWSLFTHSKSEPITQLKRELQNLAGTATVEEQAALIVNLNYELNKMSKKTTVFEKNIVVDEKDEESVMGALAAWGLNDQKLLNAARAVHRAWDEKYSN